MTGESYGGHYVPAVTARLHEANKKREGLPINLKVSILCTDVSSLTDAFDILNLIIS